MAKQHEAAAEPYHAFTTGRKHVVGMVLEHTVVDGVGFAVVGSSNKSKASQSKAKQEGQWQATCLASMGGATTLRRTRQPRCRSLRTRSPTPQQHTNLSAGVDTGYRENSTPLSLMQHGQSRVEGGG